MAAYAFPIQMALLFFPVLAALFTLPYLLGQYHKYGAVPLVRSLVVYSFILYFLCAYFEVILPLPSFAKVAAMTSPTYSLTPYAGLRAAWSALGGNLWAVLRSGAFRETLLNVALTLPFGVYLRYYFRRSWWQTLLGSFALSLFFELTQLTALYGIYPRPYRLFDATDLINNTLGGMLGFWAAPLLVFFLPSREKMERAAYRKGARVSLLRRGLALMVDWALLGLCFILCFLLGSAPLWLFALLAPLYFALLPAFCQGYTAGKLLCSIRLAAKNGGQAGPWRCLLRYALLYLPIFGALFFSSVLWTVDNGFTAPPPQTAVDLARLLQAVCFLCLGLLGLETLPKLFGFWPRYLYERFSGTLLVSAINHEEALEELGVQIEQVASQTSESQDPNTAP